MRRRVWNVNLPTVATWHGIIARNRTEAIRIAKEVAEESHPGHAGYIRRRSAREFVVTEAGAERGAA
jgi:hypothetical protein